MCIEMDYKTMVDFVISELKKDFTEEEAWEISALQMTTLKCELVECLKKNSFQDKNEYEIFDFLEKSEEMKMIFKEMMFHYYECQDVQELLINAILKLENKLSHVKLVKMNKIDWSKVN